MVIWWNAWKSLHNFFVFISLPYEHFIKQVRHFLKRILVRICLVFPQVVSEWKTKLLYNFCLKVLKSKAKFSLICPHFVSDLATYLFCFTFSLLLKLDSNYGNWYTVYVFTWFNIIWLYMCLMDCKMFSLIFKRKMIML